MMNINDRPGAPQVAPVEPDHVLDAVLPERDQEFKNLFPDCDKDIGSMGF